MTIRIKKHLFLLVFILLSCSEIVNNKKNNTIDCSHFPNLTYNNQSTDTALIKLTIQQLLLKKSNDTIRINIECLDNIVYSDVLQTITIISETINSNNKNNIPIIIYNKCLNEFSFPPKLKNVSYITLNIDKNGNIFMDNKKINLDNLCQKLTEKNNKETIKLICEDNLSTDKLIQIHDKLNKTGLKIILETINK